jgi:SAM-dependent methyltransferase
VRIVDPVADAKSFEPRFRDGDFLRKLLTVMRCPVTREPLILSADGNSVETTASGRKWSCIDYIPQMVPGHDALRVPVDHLSNSLAPQAHAIVTGTDGLVINLSAGGSAEWFPNVIEVDIAIFRNTDVIGDAHNLPFQNAIFDGCVCMNAFEHYHSPELVANEIFRVLKPGGKLLVHTAFLQPLHEAPYHFYNATAFGARKWFKHFVEDQLNTSPNFNPVFALSWILSDLDAGLRAEGALREADLLAGRSLAEITSFWRDPASRNGPVWNAFFKASAELQGRLAAGIEFIGHKANDT